MNTLLHDLRYGLRVLGKTPGLTLVAVMSLALGIGANTALFSVVDAMLLRKLPVKDPDRLVLLKTIAPQEFGTGPYSGSSGRDASGQTVRTSFPYQSYARLRAQDSGLSDVFAFGNVSMNVNSDGDAQSASGQAISGNYFSALGVSTMLGRTINDNDDKDGANPVAVLGYRYWRGRFGGDPSIVGKKVNLNNIPFTIVGVTPQGFEGTMQVGSRQDVYIPIAWEGEVSADRSYMKRNVWWLRLMGRLKPGVTPEQAQATLASALRQSVDEHRLARKAQSQPPGANPILPLSENAYPRLVLDPGSQGEMNIRRVYAPSLYMLLGVVGLVLLIACANVANLLLSRAAARQKEIGIRLALGAGRWRLIRQLLTESVMLSVIGGGLGVLFAFWIKESLFTVTAWGGNGMSTLELRLDLRVLGFTMALSMLTGILFGIVPALRATNVDLTPTLKDSVRGSGTLSRSLLSRSLVVTQVALSLLLLVAAGLFLRTLINLQSVEVGFNTDNILLFNVNPGLIGYKDDRLMQLYRQMFARLESVPGVRSVTFSTVSLLSGESNNRGFFLPGGTSDSNGRPIENGGLYTHTVRENFLEAIEIPLLAGRTLNERDNERAPRVAVVNQTFARRYFPNQSPIGQHFGNTANDPNEIEIVGLAKDAKYTSARDEVPPTAYFSWRQELRSANRGTFEVRTAGEPTAFLNAIRQAVHEVEGNLPLNSIATQNGRADETLAMERLFAKLLSLFGMLAQALAAVGLYSVMAYSVSQRTKEIGIRTALGATRSNVLSMIIRQGMTLTVIGVAIGLGSAYVLTKYLSSLTSMLYGVKATDPSTFAGIAIILSIVALLACYIPARRATRIDPMIALRYE